MEATTDSTSTEPVGNGFDNDRRQSVSVDETEGPLPPAPAVQPPVDEATQKLIDNVLYSEVRKHGPLQSPVRRPDSVPG